MKGGSLFRIIQIYSRHLIAASLIVGIVSCFLVWMNITLILHLGSYFLIRTHAASMDGPLARMDEDAVAAAFYL